MQPDSIELLLRCCSDTEWWKDGTICLVEKRKCTQTKHSAGLRHHIEEIERYVHPVVSFIYCIVYLSLAVYPGLCWMITATHSVGAADVYTHTNTHSSATPGIYKRHSHPVETTNAPQRPAVLGSHSKDSRRP